MIKFKTSKKIVKDHYEYILGAGYCSLNTLLKGFNSFGYTKVTKGWACDYYDFEGFCISTGYSPLNKNMAQDYDVIKEYESKAKEINKMALSLDSMKIKKKALILEMLEKLKKD